MAGPRDPEVQARFEAAMQDQDFKNYLERTGVLTAICDALHALKDMEPKPTSGILFINKQLEIRCGVKSNPLIALKEVTAKMEELEKKNAAMLEKEKAAILEKIAADRKKRAAEGPTEPTVDEAECLENYTII